ncbi:MAG: hypothetical protein EB078_00230 [Proteobacteria bacterium]|nr:hypothetical protein [Pseudomonadota bacterium]NDC22982.1 hypothetical protein [Pseudomonadota bacterium]NDD03307.1 hypothetical protein [Pseudomonadota bacterium]NDG25677.1 hypothetical protein [Pseudomonadota bacterium]
MKLVDQFQVIAPTRADLAGGTLDLWPLYCLIPSSCTLNIALDLFASVDFEVFESDECEVEVQTGQFSYSMKNIKQEINWERVPAALKFPVFVVRQFLLLQESLPKNLIRIKFRSSVPQGSGLGGSSTLLVAIGRGLCRVCTDYVEQGWQWRFLNWAKDTEGAFLKVPTGTQDYLAAIFGGLHGYRFELGRIQKTSFHPSVFEQINDRMLVVFSGEQHHSGISNWEVYKKAVEGNKDVLAGLKTISEIAISLDKEFRQDSVAWSQVGKLLDEEWKVRKTTFQVNTPTLDKVLEQIRKHGAMGLKVCGAAQGGSVLVLVEPSRKQKMIEGLNQQGLQILKTTGTRVGVTIREESFDMD